MTWTYSPTSLGTDLAKVRLYIGDTNTNDQLLSDEEIAVFTTLETSLFMAAARCCDAIIAKLARDIDRSNIGMSASRSQKVQHYKDLRDKLEEWSKSGGGGMFVGGVSADANETLDTDADNIKPQFTVGKFDFPGGDV